MGVPASSARIRDLQGLRPRILATAPVDPPRLEDAAGYLSSRPASSFASLVLDAPRERPLIQPRGGFARFEAQRALSHALAEAGADFIPLTIDSHTRLNDYRTAGALLERSLLEEANLLNGYPLVNHGAPASRLLYEEIDRPVSLRHGTADARLLVETALATGITEIEGGALTYTVPYSRSYPVPRALLNWQYVDRLCAECSTPARPIHRESFGVLTATMVPPAIVAAVELCELLLAAEQGVHSYSVSFGQTGSVVQDGALATVLRRAGARYLSRFGLGATRLHLVYHQWMGAFPYEYELASALIAASAQIAALIGADKVITKTKEEARGIPAPESNAEAVRLVRYVLDHAPRAGRFETPEVLREAERIEIQLDAIMEAIFAQPSEQFWHSVALAFERGILDVPFSPHEGNRNRLVTRRGLGHGIYIAEAGDVPIPRDTLEEERRLIAAAPAPLTNSVFRNVMRDLDLMVS